MELSFDIELPDDMPAEDPVVDPAPAAKAGPASKIVAAPTINVWVIFMSVPPWICFKRVGRTGNERERAIEVPLARCIA